MDKKETRIVIKPTRKVVVGLLSPMGEETYVFAGFGNDESLGSHCGEPFFIHPAGWPAGPARPAGWPAGTREDKANKFCPAFTRLP